MQIRSPPFRLPLKLTTAAQITHAHSSSSLASMHADIEAHLMQANPMKEPLGVFEPMHHSAFIRIGPCPPLLMHAVAYTHDHLPLTDRPRPKPKGHHVYDPNLELLFGDGMIAFAFELLARSNITTRDDSDRILRVIVEISRAVGSERLVEGQYRKFMRTQFEGEANVKAEAEKGKGGMHACGAACGAVLGGGTEEEIEKLRKYGFYVGIIQGLLQRVEKAEKGSKKELAEIRNLALEKLEFFEGRNIDVISCFIDV